MSAALKPAADETPLVSPWLTAKEAASYLRKSPRTLEGWRVRGGGPLYTRRGGKVLYHKDQLDAWQGAGEAAHTGQERQAGVKLPGAALFATDQSK